MVCQDARAENPSGSTPTGGGQSEHDYINDMIRPDLRCSYNHWILAGFESSGKCGYHHRQVTAEP